MLPGRNAGWNVVRGERHLWLFDGNGRRDCIVEFLRDAKACLSRPVVPHRELRVDRRGHVLGARKHAVLARSDEAPHMAGVYPESVPEGSLAVELPDASRVTVALVAVG